MGLRALVGVENAGGIYKARPVQHDGCPTVVVPALTALLDYYDRSPAAALDQLLRCDWSWLHTEPGGEFVGQPSPSQQALQVGRLDGTAGDREWAYLIGGHRLHVYLGVFPEEGPKRWQPWACWSVHELPSLPITEILAVQKAGYHAQWRAADFQSYMASVRARLAEGVR